MQVREVMSSKSVTCGPEDSLARAAQLMWEADVGCVPVLDAEGRVMGMLTDRDICMAAYTQGCGLALSSVSSAMSGQVYTCKPSESIAVAEERMRKHQVRRLPVVDKDKLVGVLSLNDIAVAAGDRKASKSGPVKLEEVATTLAHICEHRPAQVSAAAE